MPTTQITEFVGSIDTIASRTDSAGAGVTPDWKAEERRMAHEILTEGVLKPSDGWEPVAGAGATMNVIIGSGTAETDIAVVSGRVAGQGRYMVRLDEATKTVVLDAAGAAVRQDNIYLVVYDNAYDAQSRSLPRLAVRKGDAGGADPGPDADWEAYWLIATVTVPAGAADITECTVTDVRIISSLIDELLSTSFGNNLDVGHHHTGSITVPANGIGQITTASFTKPAHWNEYKILVTGGWVGGIHLNPGQTTDNIQVSTRIRIGAADDSEQYVLEFSFDELSNGSGRPIHAEASHSAEGLTSSVTLALRGTVFHANSQWSEWGAFINWTAIRTA